MGMEMGMTMDFRAAASTHSSSSRCSRRSSSHRSISSMPPRRITKGANRCFTNQTSRSSRNTFIISSSMGSLTNLSGPGLVARNLCSSPRRPTCHMEAMT